jgi:hypothetical protein
MRHNTIRPEFVESAPARLNDGVIYISDRFRTALHKCCCGCGKEVVTPLNPAGWSYTQKGGLVTLKPSIGNWSFPCKSHYLIIRNEVVWARTMTNRQIAEVKARDARDQHAYIIQLNKAKSTVERIQHPIPVKPTTSWLSLLKGVIHRWWSS